MPQDRFAARRNATLKAARAQAKGRSKPVDALLITDPVDIRYLTGMVEGGAMLVIFPRGQASLIVFNMFQHVATQQTTGINIVVAGRPADAALPGILKGKKAPKLGFQQDKISLAGYHSSPSTCPNAGLAPSPAQPISPAPSKIHKRSP